MIERLTVKVTTEERQALQILAAVESRDYRDEAHFILRQELERLGLLVPDQPVLEKNNVQPSQRRTA